MYAIRSYYGSCFGESPGEGFPASLYRGGARRNDRRPGDLPLPVEKDDVGGKRPDVDSRESYNFV